MRIFLAIVVLAVLAGLSGCSYTKPAPVCSRQPDPAKLNPAERSALADATSRYAGRCRRQNYQCEINLTKNDKGEILVTVASVYPDRASGHCVQAIGDQDLAVYDSAGRFIERAMTL